MRNILIAVGGKPIKVPIEGVEHCITSDNILHLDKQPKKCAQQACTPRAWVVQNCTAGCWLCVSIGHAAVMHIVVRRLICSAAAF